MVGYTLSILVITQNTWLERLWRFVDCFLPERFRHYWGHAALILHRPGDWGERHRAYLIEARARGVVMRPWESNELFQPGVLDWAILRLDPPLTPAEELLAIGFAMGRVGVFYGYPGLPSAILLWLRRKWHAIKCFIFARFASPSKLAQLEARPWEFCSSLVVQVLAAAGRPIVDIPANLGLPDDIYNSPHLRIVWAD